MIKLNHLGIFVSDQERSREWYTANFGFRVEFEVPERHTVALQDDADFTLFLVKDAGRARHPSCVINLEVADVEETYRELSTRGVKFVHAPQKLFWGYGAELEDPDGYLVNVWDEHSMREKGGA